MYVPGQMFKTNRTMVMVPGHVDGLYLFFGPTFGPVCTDLPVSMVVVSGDGWRVACLVRFSVVYASFPLGKFNNLWILVKFCRYL